MSSLPISASLLYKCHYPLCTFALQMSLISLSLHHCFMNIIPLYLNVLSSGTLPSISLLPKMSPNVESLLLCITLRTLFSLYILQCLVICYFLNPTSFSITLIIPTKLDTQANSLNMTPWLLGTWPQQT